MNKKIVSCFEKILAYVTSMGPGTTQFSFNGAVRKYSATAKCHFKNILSSLLTFVEHCEGYMQTIAKLCEKFSFYLPPLPATLLSYITAILENISCLSRNHLLWLEIAHKYVTPLFHHKVRGPQIWGPKPPQCHHHHHHHQPPVPRPLGIIIYLLFQCFFLMIIVTSTFSILFIFIGVGECCRLYVNDLYPITFV